MESLLARRRHLALLANKLKQTRGSSAILSGFAMIAMVELDLPEGREDEGEFDNHTSIFIFSATTVTLISLHLFALMVATSVLPYLKSAIEDIDYYLARKGVITWSNAQEPGMAQLEGQEPEADKIDKAFSDRLKHLDHFSSWISKAWFITNGIGITLFVLDLAVILHVKFLGHTPTAAWIATGILSPVFIFFIFFIYRFDRSIVGTQSITLRATAAQVDQVANKYNSNIDNIDFRVSRLGSDASTLSDDSQDSKLQSPKQRRRRTHERQHQQQLQQARDYLQVPQQTNQRCDSNDPINGNKDSKPDEAEKVGSRRSSEKEVPRNLTDVPTKERLGQVAFREKPQRQRNFSVM
eukprot:gene1580-4727_t